MVRVCVVGAGMVGVCTAWQVVEKLKPTSVVVYADKFGSETTSYGAAGIFQPEKGITSAENMEQLCADSWSYFSNVVQTSEAPTAGICIIDGYQFWTNQQPLEDEVYRKFVYDFAEIDPAKCKFIPDLSGIVQAFHYTTLLIEARRFLPWMMAKLQRRGVRFVRRHLNRLDQVAPENFDVVFNCSALGSQQLVGDTKMYPVRGQVIRARAPWVKEFILLDDWTYIIPCQDSVVMGGVGQKGNWNRNLDESDRLGIKERCQKLVPSLVDAVVEQEWTGLRPFREELRIEEGCSLTNSTTGHKTRVIHNYGHGSNGVGLSMGSACAAMRIACKPSKL